jgi:hypothetical protein
MANMVRNATLRFSWLPLLLVALGCGGKGISISGQVTLDGDAVENGYIAFIPADGLGPTAGARVQHGAYTVTIIRPGEKIVEVTAAPPQQPGGGSDPPTIKPAAPLISSSTMGNNRHVTIDRTTRRVDMGLHNNRQQ